MPSNYVKKEKKSLLDKIIPRKIHSSSSHVVSSSKPVTQVSNEDIKSMVKNGSIQNFVSKAIVKHKYTAEK